MNNKTTRMRLATVGPVNNRPSGFFSPSGHDPVSTGSRLSTPHAAGALPAQGPASSQGWADANQDDAMRDDQSMRTAAEEPLSGGQGRTPREIAAAANALIVASAIILLVAAILWGYGCFHH